MQLNREHAMQLDREHAMQLDREHAMQLDREHAMQLDREHAMQLDREHAMQLDREHAMQLDRGPKGLNVKRHVSLDLVVHGSIGSECCGTPAAVLTCSYISYASTCLPCISPCSYVSPASLRVLLSH